MMAKVHGSIGIHPWTGLMRDSSDFISKLEIWEKDL